MKRKGPRGTVAARKILKKHNVISFEQLKYLVEIVLEDEELEAVLNYLIENDEVKVQFGLKNCFPKTPIYETKKEVPLHTVVNGNYFINLDCIIPLYIWTK